MNPACTRKGIALTLMLTLTGIQYHALVKNCDLIVKSCGFHKAFKTDSPGDWRVESRTCFNGIPPSPPLLSCFFFLFFLLVFVFLLCFYFYCTSTLQYTIYTLQRNSLDVSHTSTILISSQAVRVRLICVKIIRYAQTLSLTLSRMADRVALVLMT